MKPCQDPSHGAWRANSLHSFRFLDCLRLRLDPRLFWEETNGKDSCGTKACAGGKKE